MKRIGIEIAAPLGRGTRFGPKAGLKSVVAAGIAVMLACAGCGSQIPLLPNSDPALRKRPADFASDAALRHPFKQDAPSGGEAQGRAAVNYTMKWLEVVNLSDEDWDDAEIWLNRQFVVYVPRIAKNGPTVTTLNFWMFYDEKGNSFPNDNASGAESLIHQLEMYRHGKVYSLKLQLAD